jgi:hypothetical protein
MWLLFRIAKYRTHLDDAVLEKNALASSRVLFAFTNLDSHTCDL